MAIDGEREPVADPVDRRLELIVGEGQHPPAAVADRVVMVLARVMSRLEAGDAVSRIHALDEGELVQELERAVDGGAAHRPPPVGQRALELLGAAQASRRGEFLEHELAAAAAAQPCGLERRVGALEPVLAHTEK